MCVHMHKRANCVSFAGVQQEKLHQELPGAEPHRQAGRPGLSGLGSSAAEAC